MKRPSKSISNAMEKLAQKAARWTGSSRAFAMAVGTIIVWAAIGPHFRYSDTWQLVVNTGTTVITFLMVFLIQRSQNKDAMAIQLKLNELVAALHGASNRLISVEQLTEDDLQTLQQHYEALSRMASKDSKITESHSVEEASRRHRAKTQKTNRNKKEA
jgi:low affinity Fe/Cu permease